MALRLPVLLLVVVALASLAVNDTSNQFQLTLESGTIPACRVYKNVTDNVYHCLVSKGAQPDILCEHERCFASTYSNEFASFQSDSMNAAGKSTVIKSKIFERMTH